MIYFVPSNLLNVSLEVSWWILKNTGYYMFQGLKYGISSLGSHPQGDGKIVAGNFHKRSSPARLTIQTQSASVNP